MADLWTLQLMFAGAQARTVTLVYHSEAAAREALEVVRGPNPVQGEFPSFRMVDHYGTEVVVFGGGPLEAVALQGVGEAGEGGIELALAQARVQARAQERSGRDPVLREAQQRQAHQQSLLRAMPLPGMPPGKM